MWAAYLRIDAPTTHIVLQAQDNKQRVSLCVTRVAPSNSSAAAPHLELEVDKPVRRGEVVCVVGVPLQVLLCHAEGQPSELPQAGKLY